MTLAKSSPKPRSGSDQDLRALLTQHGMRVTEQRLVLLRELINLRVPTSHPELTERLVGSALDRATIYRNLLSLAAAGIVVRTQLGDGIWRYELPSSQFVAHTSHPHFVCNECGEIACLPKGAVALRGEALRNRVAEVQLRGRCISCAE